MRALAIITLIVLSACQSRSRAPEYQIELPATPVPDHLYDIELKRLERQLEEAAEALSR